MALAITFARVVSGDLCAGSSSVSALATPNSNLMINEEWQRVDGYKRAWQWWKVKQRAL